MAFDSRLLSGIGVLAAVVEAGTFVRAGEVLGITQSGVSRAISRLEDRVGIKIFQRTARSVSLTEEGRAFFEKVEPLLSGIEEAAEEAGESAVVVRGRLRVNVESAFGRHVLVPALGPFLERHPQLLIDVVVRDRIGDMVAEGFDVAVRFGEPQPSALVARLLLRTRIITCATPDYVARNGLPRHPRDIARHRCILIRNPATGQPFGWEFHRKGETVPAEPRGMMIVNETGGLMAAIQAGLGIGQALAIYSDDAIREGRLVHILPDWSDETYPLYAYHRSGHLMSAKVRAFMDLLVELARRY